MNFYAFNLLFASFLVIFKYIGIFDRSISSSILLLFSLIFTSKNKCIFGRRGEMEEWMPHPKAILGQRSGLSLLAARSQLPAQCFALSRL